MLSRAEKGLWNGANVPLGYKWNPDKKFPEIDENESKIIKLIYEMYGNVESTTKVLIHLNSNNIPTKRGGKWTTKGITDIIRSPFYKGTYRYNYKESARGKTKDKSDWIVIDGNHEAIITKEQWDLCNSIMDKNAERNGADHKRKTYTHIFTKVLFCAKCGTHYSGSRDTMRNNGFMPSQYRCISKLKYKECNSAVISDVILGPIVFNYISNLIKAQNSDLKSIKELEDVLLSGNYLTSIYGIEEEDLQATYSTLFYNESRSNLINFNNKESPLINNEIVELDILKSEKTKIDCALERLQNLFLFSDDAMSEKDYLVQKQSLTSKLEDVNFKIQKIKSDTNTNMSVNDENIFKKASEFLIKNSVLSQDNIDFQDLVIKTNKSLLRDFILEIIEKIIVRDKKVESIIFKNGLEHKFIYRY
jgi:site-specific DNA recombinase